jgi:PIN domain nuclease of toxin-antitoxin system
VSAGRLAFDREVGVWLDEALAEASADVVPIDATIATRSTRIGADFHGDPADQLIAATSIVLDAPLVTADANLHGSRALTTIW